MRKFGFVFMVVALISAGLFSRLSAAASMSGCQAEMQVLTLIAPMDASLTYQSAYNLAVDDVLNEYNFSKSELRDVTNAQEYSFMFDKRCEVSGSINAAHQQTLKAFLGVM